MLWVTRKKAGKIASPTSYTRNSSFLCIIAEKKMDDLYFLGYAMTKSGKNKTIGLEVKKTKRSDKRGKTSKKKAPDKRERPRCQELYG